MRATEYSGNLKFDRELEKNHLDYLIAFTSTLRVVRRPESVNAKEDIIRLNVDLPLGKECEFYTGAFNRSGEIAEIEDYNAVPENQPSSWCCWKPSKDQLEFVPAIFDSYYSFIPWIQYLVANFIKPWNYSLNGRVKVKSIYDDGIKILSVKDNDISVMDLKAFS